MRTRSSVLENAHHRGELRATRNGFERRRKDVGVKKRTTSSEAPDTKQRLQKSTQGEKARGA